MNSERLAPLQHDTLDDVPEPSEQTALFGHEEAERGLAAAFRAGTLAHALIFAGPQGIGKATLAFRLARHMLAHPDPASAPEEIGPADPASPLFRRVAGGAHPSVLHLARPYDEKRKLFRTVITADEIRKVSRFLSLKAHDGGHRVVIVDPSDDMNQNAANALLKNLEEPPSRTLFILVSHRPGSLIATIRSRCQLVRLGPLGETALFSALAAAGVEPPQSEDARATLAAQVGGSVRRAILLTHYGGLEIADAVGMAACGEAYDAATAGQLADAVAGRDKGVQFQLFNQNVLDRLADAARRAAGEGRRAAAARGAEAFAEAGRIIAETETYNLDQRQHVAGLLQRLHAAVRM